MCQEIIKEQEEYGIPDCLLGKCAESQELHQSREYDLLDILKR